MKKKLLVILLLVCVMLLTLSSCVNEVYNFEINKNGGSVKHEQIITKEVYDTLISMGVTRTEIEEGGKLTFYKENNVEYVKFTESNTFDSLYDLNKYLSQLGDNEEIAEDTKLSDNFFKHTKIEADEESKILSMTGVVSKQNDISLYTSCTIIFKFAGKIIDYNIGEKINNNTIKIDMTEIWKENSGKIFSIESEIPSGIISSINSIFSDLSNSWINLALVAIIIVIVILLIIIIVINKKPKKSLQNNDNTDKETSKEETTSN